jgi:lysophospholipase L1-like esterase
MDLKVGLTVRRKMMKTIVCTGDSHTWGQGAKGAVQSINPPAEGGDLRLLSFQYDCYVNLLRRMVCERTNSEFTEYEAVQLKLPLTEACAVLQSSLKIELVAELIRIQFRKQKTPSSASIYLDGALYETVNLQSGNTGYGFYGMKTVGIFCGEGLHTLEIVNTAGSVLIYRIETYKGEYAVINSGIGSCSTLRYIEEYWNDYVECYHPSLVLMEAHTINDWLTKCPPDEYEKNLVRFIRKIKQINAIPVLMTVSPILGNQSAPFNDYPYDEFIKASRRAAQSENINIADANLEIRRQLYGLSQERQFQLMFSDNWHINDLGHELYAQCAIKKIEREITMQKAKAAIYTGANQPFEIKEYPLVTPPEGMAKIKLIASGICGTDIHIHRGKIPLQPPLIIGHEFVGCVEELSARDSEKCGIQPGDNVIVDIACPCGECVLCKQGDDANCLNMGVTQRRQPGNCSSFLRRLRRV